jgi:hypothetical protein
MGKQKNKLYSDLQVYFQSGVVINCSIDQETSMFHRRAQPRRPQMGTLFWGNEMSTTTTTDPSEAKYSKTIADMGKFPPSPTQQTISTTTTTDLSQTLTSNTTLHMEKGHRSSSKESRRMENLSLKSAIPVGEVHCLSVSLTIRVLLCKEIPLTTKAAKDFMTSLTTKEKDIVKMNSN